MGESELLMPPITNILETTRRLEGMGFPTSQARGLADPLEESAVATQQDLKAFISGQIDTLRTEIRNELKAMEERLRSAIHLSEANLRAEFQKDLRWLLFWFITSQGALILFYMALAKFVISGL